MKQPIKPSYPSTDGIKRTTLKEFYTSSSSLNLNLGELFKIAVQSNDIESLEQCVIEIDSWSGMYESSSEVDACLVHIKKEDMEEHKKRVAQYFIDLEKYNQDMILYNSYLQEEEVKEQYNLYLELKEKFERPTKGWKDKEV